MEVGNDYRLETDGGKNVILLRRHPLKKSSGERWRAVGYYPDYKAALRAIVQCGVLETPAQFKDVLEKLNKIDDMIAALPDTINRL